MATAALEDTSTRQGATGSAGAGRGVHLGPATIPLAIMCLGALCVLGACFRTVTTSATTSATAAHPTMPTSPPPTPTRVLRLVLTADEHGWLLPLREGHAGIARGGVLAFADRLAIREGYTGGASGRDAGWLLMSTGDMWTGPFESTVLEGKPMVHAMNLLGYTAAAVGNHDYDFGVAVAASHAAESTFPFLAANLRERSTGEPPVWAKPYVVVNAGGMRVGIVGLTNVDSPVTTDPRNLEELRFISYAETIEEWVPRARAAGAEQVIVLVHDGIEAADALIPTLRRLGVRAAAFGHRHVAAVRTDDNGTTRADDDIVLCNPGPFLRTYCRIDLDFEGTQLVRHAVAIRPVEQPLAEPLRHIDLPLKALVDTAEQNAQRLGGEVLVDNVRHLRRGVDGPLGQMVVDAWLDAIPWAQVAVTNAGGLRQDLAAGPVRVRDIVSVLPFNNNLLVVALRGAQLRETLAHPEAIVSGVHFTYREDNGRRVVGTIRDRRGVEIADDAVLHVVVHDFIYRGGDHFRFQLYDAEPEDTATDWREPVLRHLRVLRTQDQKLDVVADERARREQGEGLGGEDHAP